MFSISGVTRFVGREGQEGSDMPIRSLVVGTRPRETSIGGGGTFGEDY